MKYVNVVVIVLIILTAGGVAAVALRKPNNTPVLSPTPTSAPMDKSITEVSPTETASVSPSPTSSSLPLAQKSVATFDTSSNIDVAMQTEITKKVIEPFLDYYRDQYNAGYVKSLLIAKNTGASVETYPYKGSYTFEGGVNGGFLIMKKGQGVDWWYPECLNGCHYSASFSAKYPEIVAKTK